MCTFYDCNLQVQMKTLKHISSDRLTFLGRSKKIPDDYKLARSLPTRVNDAARKCVARSRTLELAVPNPRPTFTHAQYDPAAFKVKRAALKAKIKPRTLEISEPRCGRGTLRPSSSDMSAFRVKAGALTASVSSRIKILSEPKIRKLK